MDEYDELDNSYEEDLGIEEMNGSVETTSIRKNT